MELADTVRVEVAVEYKTRAWQTTEVDLGPGEAREVDLVTPAIEGVAEMGLPITNQVRCLGINEQVAQKLHACTGPQRQDRARDILDILVVDMLGQLDRLRARAAAERIFGREIPIRFHRRRTFLRSGVLNLKRWPLGWDTVRRRRQTFKKNLRI